MKKIILILGTTILLVGMAACRTESPSTIESVPPEPEITASTPEPTPAAQETKVPSATTNLKAEGTKYESDPIETVSPDGEAQSPIETPAPAETQAPIELFESIIATKYTNTAANIRESYTTTSAKIATLPINTEIKVIGIGLEGTEASGWSKIEFNGSEVYVSSSLLSDFKIEIQQPVQTQKPQTALTKEDTPVQQPTQQKPSSSQGVPQEILDALEASGSKPSAEGGFDRLPQGPVVVQNTELILPD